MLVRMKKDLTSLCNFFSSSSLCEYSLSHTSPYENPIAGLVTIPDCEVVFFFSLPHEYVYINILSPPIFQYPFSFSNVASGGSGFGQRKASHSTADSTSGRSTLGYNLNFSNSGLRSGSKRTWFFFFFESWRCSIISSIPTKKKVFLSEVSDILRLDIGTKGGVNLM